MYCNCTVYPYLAQCFVTELYSVLWQHNIVYHDSQYRIPCKYITVHNDRTIWCTVTEQYGVPWQYNIVYHASTIYRIPCQYITVHNDSTISCTVTVQYHVTWQYNTVYHASTIYREWCANIKFFRENSSVIPNKTFSIDLILYLTEIREKLLSPINSSYTKLFERKRK